MGVETILLVFMIIIVVAISVMVAKARRRMAGRIKTPEQESQPRTGGERRH